MFDRLVSPEDLVASQRLQGVRDGSWVTNNYRPLYRLKRGELSMYTMSITVRLHPLGGVTLHAEGSGHEPFSLMTCGTQHEVAGLLERFGLRGDADKLRNMKWPRTEPIDAVTFQIR